MKKEIITTADGSHTISIPEWKVSYHSIHGAIQESMHVFIEAGLHHLIDQSPNQPINIFEMGFGTGLNAFLTAIEAHKLRREIQYVAIEQFPISMEEAMQLNYAATLQHENLFHHLHKCDWDKKEKLSDLFAITKIKNSLINFSPDQQFNLIYFDAFAPAAQPELWTKEVFEKLRQMLLLNGILVTYCSKGDVRRAMMAAGFDVKKLPGPPGKREILTAMKY